MSTTYIRLMRALNALGKPPTTWPTHCSPAAGPDCARTA
jgi:hypothetical protein